MTEFFVSLNPKQIQLLVVTKCCIVTEMPRNDDEKVIIGMDYDKMYPSLNIPTVCAVAAEELTNSNLELDVDVLELSLYISIMYDRDHLINIGLGDVTHTRMYN